jgi:hypothetical protein
MVPQNWLPALAQVSGTQPVFTHVLCVHVSLAAHAPQSSSWPQPSPMPPQKLASPALQASGAQTVGLPWQRLALQDQPFAQVEPQSSALPQPSPISPQ